jgi:2-methylfumaryl-CoA hydratase
VKRPRWGRRADDFRVGDVHEHPWEVTIDAGMIAVYQASFLDATSVFASTEAARAVGLRERPVPPLLLLNLALSFSVHDVSEQAIAHLAYVDVRFPVPAYPGDTVRAASKVIEVKPTRTGDRAVVGVRTVLRTGHAVVCAFDRRALVPTGRATDRPSDPPLAGDFDFAEVPRAPALSVGAAGRGFEGFVEDFAAGDVVLHDLGRTIGESEHMQLATLFRNTHPLHTDERYAAMGGSFAGTRIVYGGLVLAWAAALSSRDVAGNAIWDLGWSSGAHPAAVIAGDTLYAASKVLSIEDQTVTLRLVATKNVRPSDVIERGQDLFAPELGKPAPERIGEKVFESNRMLWLRRRG